MSLVSSRNPHAVRLFRLFTLCTIFIALGSLACARRGMKGAEVQVAPTIQFPSAGELQAIAGEPAPDLAEIAAPKHRSVDRWELAGPLPDPSLAEAQPVENAYTQHFAAFMSDNRLRASLALDCFAREMGRFRLEHGLPPDRELTAFIAGRCGVHDPSVQSIYTDFPPDSALGIMMQRFGAVVDRALASVSTSEGAQGPAEPTHDQPPTRDAGDVDPLSPEDRDFVEKFEQAMLAELEADREAAKLERDRKPEVADPFAAAAPPENPLAALGSAILAANAGRDGRPRSTGMWIGFKDGHVGISFAISAPKVEISEVGVHPQDPGLLIVRGVSHSGFSWLHGASTLGDLQVGTCTADPRAPVAPPLFALLCPIDPRDEYAILELHAGQADRVLGLAIYRNMVLLRGEAATFRTRPLRHQAPTLLQAIGALRDELGLPAMREVEEQSAVVTSLLPHLYKAATAGDRGLLDRIVLGILAGWHVPGELAWGNFVTFRQSSSLPSQQKLAELLFFPLTRRMLLDPTSEAIALGSWRGDPQHDELHALATYRLYTPSDHAAEAAQILDELDRQRASRGHGPVRRIAGPKPDGILDAGIREIQEGEATPSEALDTILFQFVERTGRDFYGLVFQTPILEGFSPTFEPRILNARGVEVAVRIGFVKPRGAAWGEYIVFLSYALHG